MLNKVILTGRLTKPLELKKTPTGRSVASFTLAVERRQKSSSGEKLTDFHDCVIWNTPAETLALWTTKGSMISVVGRLEKRSYTNNNGHNVTVTEVIVEEFMLLEGRKKVSESIDQVPGIPSNQSAPGESNSSSKHFGQTSFFQGQSTQIVD